LIIDFELIFGLCPCIGPTPRCTSSQRTMQLPTLSHPTVYCQSISHHITVYNVAWPRGLTISCLTDSEWRMTYAGD